MVWIGKKSDVERFLVFGFEGTYEELAQWLSWLERRPVTAEVESSSLFWVVCIERYMTNEYMGS